MTATMTQEITAPGVYDLTAEAYHADPVPGGSLSSSGARRLLPPGCPALYRYERDHPPAPKRTFDLGHAAHRKVLGAGPPIVVINAADYRTKSAQEKRDAAHAAGAVPLLEAEHEQVEAMAAALREHPEAGPLLRSDRGQPEQSLFWVDRPTGVWRRARPDWLPSGWPGPRLILPEYKSCRSADPEAIQRAIAEYGYHQQADWYLDAVRALGLADERAAFVLICQEKTPPYLITVVEPDQTALAVGRLLNRDALRLYRECVDSGRWPGYADDVLRVSLPPWVENRYQREDLM